MKTVTAKFSIEYDFSESIAALQELQTEPLTDQEIKDIVVEDVLNFIAAEDVCERHITVQIDDEAASYVESGGCVCPHCSGETLLGSNIEVDSGIAWQRVSCETCGAHWQELYQLTGFSNLVRPN